MRVLDAMDPPLWHKVRKVPHERPANVPCDRTAVARARPV